MGFNNGYTVDQYTVGELVHTAFRKAVPDSKTSRNIHDAINKMDNDDWSAIVNFIANGLGDLVIEDLEEGRIDLTNVNIDNELMNQIINGKPKIEINEGIKKGGQKEPPENPRPIHPPHAMNPDNNE